MFTSQLQPIGTTPKKTTAQPVGTQTGAEPTPIPVPQTGTIPSLGIPLTQTQQPATQQPSTGTVQPPGTAQPATTQPAKTTSTTSTATPDQSNALALSQALQTTQQAATPQPMGTVQPTGTVTPAKPTMTTQAATVPTTTQSTTSGEPPTGWVKVGSWNGTTWWTDPQGGAHIGETPWLDNGPLGTQIPTPSGIDPNTNLIGATPDPLVGGLTNPVTTPGPDLRGGLYGGTNPVTTDPFVPGVGEAGPLVGPDVPLINPGTMTDIPPTIDPTTPSYPDQIPLDPNKQVLPDLGSSFYLDEYRKMQEETDKKVQDQYAGIEKALGDSLQSQFSDISLQQSLNARRANEMNAIQGGGAYGGAQAAGQAQAQLGGQQMRLNAITDVNKRTVAAKQAYLQMLADRAAQQERLATTAEEAQRARQQQIILQQMMGSYDIAGSAIGQSSGDTALTGAQIQQILSQLGINYGKPTGSP